MTPEPITNSDVFLWALFELGGADAFVDVEDVFLRAFKLAPMRLSWRTRADIPDLKKCSKALRDIEANKPGLLVKQGSDFRRLNVDGQQWIEDNFDRLAEALGSDRIVKPPRARFSSRLVSEATRSDVFQQWTSQCVLAEEKWQFAELLRCAPDSSRTLWHSRLETLRSAAYSAGRTDLLEFLDALAVKRPDWF